MFKSMAQIKRIKKLGLVISSTAGSIILAIAICVVLASFAGFSQGKAPSFDPFRETPLRDKGENPTDGFFWLDDQTDIQFTITAVLTGTSRVPIKNASNRYKTYIAHPLSVKAKFLNITPFSIFGGAGITITAADICTYLLIDLPPPYPKA
jgi:hypothetical protein